MLWKDPLGPVQSGLEEGQGPQRRGNIRGNSHFG